MLPTHATSFNQKAAIFLIEKQIFQPFGLKKC
jgi:hypothetical protein